MQDSPKQIEGFDQQTTFAHAKNRILKTHETCMDFLETRSKQSYYLKSKSGNPTFLFQNLVFWPKRKHCHLLKKCLLALS